MKYTKTHTHTHSYSINQPTVHALCTRWSEFYQQYQSLQQWLRTMDTEMSNLNPFVNDMAIVRLQLEKQKVCVCVSGDKEICITFLDKVLFHSIFCVYHQVQQLYCYRGMAI